MEQEDPERRIADLERQLAEQKHIAEPKYPDGRLVVTPEAVHNVAFSKAGRGERGYDEDEVDAFLERVKAALRDPAATGGVTPSDFDNVAFSKPPIGKRGYHEEEVDAFLDLVKTELTPRLPDQRPEQPVRCLLYRLGGRDQTTPVFAIDMDKDAIRVIGLASNALLASASLAQVTADPAEHGGSPVLVVGVPGLSPLTIQPHLEDGFLRPAPPGGWALKLKTKKADYYVIDEDWRTLVEKFGVDPDLEIFKNPTLRKIRDRIHPFYMEWSRDAPWTWRTPSMFGVGFTVAGALATNPVLLGIGVILLILAGLAWYLGWEL
jgi:DivIVA domain-containing protein